MTAMARRCGSRATSTARSTPAPTTLRRGFGFSWAIGGWLLFHALQRLAPATVQAMRQRVVNEMDTTFASHYTARITLEQALEPETVTAYMRKSTGVADAVRAARAGYPADSRPGNIAIRPTSSRMQPRNGSTPRITVPTDPRPRTLCTM